MHGVEQRANHCRISAGTHALPRAASGFDSLIRRVRTRMKTEGAHTPVFRAVHAIYIVDTPTEKTYTDTVRGRGRIPRPHESGNSAPDKSDAPRTQRQSVHALPANESFGGLCFSGHGGCQPKAENNAEIGLLILTVPCALRYRNRRCKHNSNKVTKLRLQKHELQCKYVTNTVVLRLAL